MKRVLGTLVVVALALAMPTALAQSNDGDGGSTAADEKVVLRLGTTNDIDSLNPFKLVEIPSFEVASLQYNLLVGFSDDDFGPAPELAESWETSPDGLTWTFNLNPDAKWSDGEPLTSEDVKYTIERIIEEKQGLFIDYVRQIDEIETPDEQTVVMTTKEPSVQMLSMFVYVLPKHVWEDVPADESKTFPNEPAVGSGPFTAVEWNKGQFVRLERNPNWWGPEPAIDEIFFQFYDNSDTMIQALKNGEVDYVYNPPVNLFKSLETEQDITTVSAPDPGFTELGFNLYDPSPDVIEEFGAPKTTTGHPALLDPNVRAAINWAIDENELTEKILRGEGIPGSTLVPPGLAKYHLDLDDAEVQSFDIDRAKELLAEAGWEDTNDNGTVDKGGQELELRLFVRSESDDTVKAGQFLTDWLNQAGIAVDTKALSDNALTDAIYAADFDMFVWGWGSDPDPDFILSVLSCDQFMGWSDTFYCNEQYTDMYQEQKTQLDLDERAQTIKEMQQIVYEENPYVIFYYDNQFEAYRTDKLEGWSQYPTSAETGQIFFTSTYSNYLNLRPVGSGGEAAEAASDEGSSPLLFVVIGLGAVVLIGVIVALARRGSAEDRA